MNLPDGKKNKELKMNNANAVNFPNTHRYAFGNVNYLYDYYPANRFPDNALPEPLRNIRKALWDFKKGICNFFSRTLVENLVNVIAQSGQFNSERVAVLCVPASSEYKTQLRYSLLLSRLKQVLPRARFINDQIVFTGQKAQKHLQSDRNINSCSHFYINGPIPEPDILVIDDIVTRGGTFSDVVQMLDNSYGAKRYCFMTIARTVSPNILL